jgi:DNA-binding CsgD family transcriptional regulator
MDTNDLKGSSGDSMAHMGSEADGRARMPRTSAGHRVGETPSESAGPVAQTYSGLTARAFHPSFACRRNAIDAAGYLLFAPIPLSQFTSKEAQEALTQGWRAILNLELDQVFAIVAALELGVREFPPRIKNRLLGEIQVLRAAGFALSDRAMLIRMYNCPAPIGQDLLPFLNTLIRRLPDRPISNGSTPKVGAAGRILSPRECCILQLIGRGMSNKRIAQELKIAPETVKSHAKHILVKLSAQTRAEAVARAIGLRLL